MQGILADKDVEETLQILLGILAEGPWREFLLDLQLTVHTFESLSLSREATDFQVWQVCQQQQILLVTANRTEDSPDALGRAIQQLGNSESLPVLTLSNPRRIHRSKNYAGRVVERLLDYLWRIDSLRGAGRLYLP